MFNLDDAISRWRQPMAAGGLKTPDVLAELESHLRDEVDQQGRAGAGQEQAFDAAVRRIGECQALKQEFRKVGCHRVWALRDNPVSLNILGLWLIIMGLKNLGPWPMLLNVLRHGHFTAGQLLFTIISVALGVGLLRRNGVCRLCAMAWFTVFIAGHLYDVAAHGLAQSFYAYAPHMPRAGETVRYFLMGLLPVSSYPLFYASVLLNTAMLLFGIFVLNRPSVRNLFRPVLT